MTINGILNDVSVSGENGIEFAFVNYDDNFQFFGKKENGHNWDVSGYEEITGISGDSQYYEVAVSSDWENNIQPYFYFVNPNIISSVYSSLPQLNGKVTYRKDFNYQNIIRLEFESSSNVEDITK